jgi:Spy/CpxP family protein refolding chaperone
MATTNGGDGRGTWRAGFSRRGFWIGLGAAGLASLGGLWLVGREAHAHAGFLGRGHFGHGHFGRGHFGHGPFGAHHRGPGFLAEDAARHARWLVRVVDGTPEQEARVAELLAAAAPDFEALHERHREAREAFVAALAGERVDREALEALRAGELAAAEEASRTLVALLADVAEVLTPEQRAELARFADH